MPSGYSSNFLLFFLCIASCCVVEAAETFPKKWWYLIIAPAILVLGVAVFLLACCLRRRCRSSTDAEFDKMLYSGSSVSRCSHNSTFYQAALKAEYGKYEDPTKNRDEILTIDLSDRTEQDAIGGTNGIGQFANTVPPEGARVESPENREISVTVSQSPRFSPTSGRRSTETEKQSESTKTEFHLNTCAANFGNGGLRNDTPSDKVTVPVVNRITESTGVHSTQLLFRFQSRTISATSDSDYYDLDDDEVVRSIQNEEHWNSTNTDDSLFTSEETQGPKRPLPEITESLDIVMENEMYSSF